MLGLTGEERSGAMEERGVRVGMNERAGDHRQLYWVESGQGASVSLSQGRFRI